MKDLFEQVKELSDAVAALEQRALKAEAACAAKDARVKRILGIWELHHESCARHDECDEVGEGEECFDHDKGECPLCDCGRDELRDHCAAALAPNCGRDYVPRADMAAAFAAQERLLTDAQAERDAAQHRAKELEEELSLRATIPAIDELRRRAEAAEARVAEYQREVERRDELLRGADADLKAAEAKAQGAADACEATRQALVHAEARVKLLEGQLALHPTGHCSCGGEGWCQWCLMIEAQEELQEERVAYKQAHADAMTVKAERDTLAAKIIKLEDEILFATKENTRLATEWGNARRRAAEHAAKCARLEKVIRENALPWAKEDARLIDKPYLVSRVRILTAMLEDSPAPAPAVAKVLRVHGAVDVEMVTLEECERRVGEAYERAVVAGFRKAATWGLDKGYEVADAIRGLAAKPEEKLKERISAAMERSKPLVEEVLKIGRAMTAQPGMVGADSSKLDTTPLDGYSDATHRCKVCGAHWAKIPTPVPRDPTGHVWSLRSRACGKCCDNVAMGEQIEPLPVSKPKEQRITDAERARFDETNEVMGVARPSLQERVIAFIEEAHGLVPRDSFALLTELRATTLYTEAQVLRALEARWLDADKSRTPNKLILARVREGGER